MHTFFDYYIHIFIFTRFIISFLLETTEKGEPPPSGPGSPQLLRYIIKLSFIVIFESGYAIVSFVVPL